MRASLSKRLKTMESLVDVPEIGELLQAEIERAEAAADLMLLAMHVIHDAVDETGLTDSMQTLDSLEPGVVKMVRKIMAHEHRLGELEVTALHLRAADRAVIRAYNTRAWLRDEARRNGKPLAAVRPPPREVTHAGLPPAPEGFPCGALPHHSTGAVP